MRKFYLNLSVKHLLLACTMILTVGTFAQQVNVSATAGTPAGSYPTLKAAFDAINAGTHQGDIAIGISANTTETAPAVLNGSGAGPALYTNVIISPTVDGVVISGATTTGRGLIEFKGADNVTINGDNPGTPGTNRDLTITNTAANTVAYASVIRIATAATVVTSADNISILNCNLIGNATDRNVAGNTSTSASENASFVIYAGGNGGATAVDSPTAITSVTTNTALNGTTINNLIVSNNTMISAARALVFNGANASVSNGITVTQNLIGDQTSNITGAAPYNSPSNTIYTKGIFIAGVTGATITGNTIKNIISFVPTATNGIEFNSAIGTGAGTLNISGNTITGIAPNAAAAANGIVFSACTVPYTITGNTIYNLQTGSAGSSATAIAINTSTASSGLINRNNIYSLYARNSSGFAARGIVVGAGSNVTIQNNMISDLVAAHNNSTTSTTFAVKGIAISSGTGHKVYHNSVNITGPMFTGVGAADNTTCFMLSSTTSTGVDVRNNIFSNTMSGPAGTVHACLQLPSGATSALNLTLNNNTYYYGTNANNYLGITTSTFNSFATFAALVGYTSTLSAAGTNDNASYASTNAAPFVNTTDAHLSLVSSELINVEQKGVVGTGVTVDIDGNTRPDGATTLPDIGADEVSAPVACAGIPTAGSINAATNTICFGNSVNMSLSGVPAESGLTFQWQSSTVDGGPYTTNLGTNTTQNTGAIANTTYYIVTTTCANSGLSATTAQFTVTVNSNPVIGINQNPALYCAGSTAATLTASGAVNYAWTPATGLSTNIGATVLASPTANTYYTITGVDANGCIGVKTVLVKNSAAMTLTGPSASPSAVCSGSDSQLSVTPTQPINQGVSNYTLTASTTTYTPITGTTCVTAVGDDASETNIPFGFTFKYRNQNYTAFSINTNGAIRLVTTAFSTAANGLASNSDVIAPFWDDNEMTGGNIQYLLSGTSPNQTMTVQWTGMHTGSNGNITNPTIDVQLVIYEATGVIEFIYGPTSAPLVGTTASIGISGGTGAYQSVTPLNPITNTTTSTTTENTSINSAVNIPSGTMYTFTPPPVATFTYDWTPTTGLTAANISNPVATAVTAPVTYSVAVASNYACTASGNVSLTVNPLPSAPTATNSAQCGAAVPTASVTSTTGATTPNFSWYAAATGGTALQTSTSTTYTSAVSTTTTFYVAEVDGTTGCESPRTAVTVTVASADGITASTNFSSICVGSSVNLSVSNNNATPVQNYVYTWTNAETGSGLVSQTGSNQVVTPTQAGTYTYNVEGVDGSCTALSSVVVTVNPYTATLTPINITCNGANNGSFSLSSEACGTAASYSVDGGAFGAIPTNLTPGNHNVIVQNTLGFQTSTIVVNISQPAAIPLPIGISNVSICQGSPSATLSMLAGAQSFSSVVNFNVTAQPAETQSAPGNLVSSAALPVLPAGATITSVVLNYNGIVTHGGEWQSDVRLGLSGAFTNAAAAGTGAIGTGTVAETAFNYTRSIPIAGFPTGGGTINLLYWDNFNDVTAGPDATFPTGPTAATLTITYSYTNPSSVNWFDAATAGTLQGTGTPFQTVGTALLPNTNTPGTYTFYAEGTDGTCVSASRTPVTVTVKPTSASTTTITACGSYTWTNAVNYTASGIYTQTLVNSVGCDSIATLNLTINQPSSSTQAATACASYVWPVNSTTYSTSGTYTHTLVGANSVGCDSTITLNLTINQPTTSSQSATACVSYQWPVNGTTYTSTGAYTHTLVGANSVGCDSTITLNLTINQPTTSSQSATACVSYQWPVNGTTYTTSGAYTHTLVGANANGCDSTITLNLTINQPTTGVATISACGSYTWIDNVTYTASNNTATHTIVGGAANGCDSTVTLNLTINQPTTGTDVITACGSYTWIDNVTYTASNSTATHTIVGGAANGCDSTVTLNLTINQPATGTDVISACDSYTWIDNVTYTSSNSTATHTIVGGAANGCDSTVTLNLTITASPIATATDNGDATITASAGTTYEWLDCSNGATVGTTQTFTATVNGSYQVVVSNGLCDDTSSCVVIDYIGIKEIAGIEVQLMPNPTRDFVTIQMSIASALVEVRDAQGKIVMTKEMTSGQQVDLSHVETGIYFFSIQTPYGSVVKRVVKN